MLNTCSFTSAFFTTLHALREMLVTGLTKAFDNGHFKYLESSVEGMVCMYEITSRLNLLLNWISDPSTVKHVCNKFFFVVVYWPLICHFYQLAY